jgi:hypothetical protein
VIKPRIKPGIQFLLLGLPKSQWKHIDIRLDVREKHLADVQGYVVHTTIEILFWIHHIWCILIESFFHFSHLHWEDLCAPLSLFIEREEKRET